MDWYTNGTRPGYVFGDVMDGAGQVELTRKFGILYIGAYLEGGKYLSLPIAKESTPRFLTSLVLVEDDSFPLSLADRVSIHAARDDNHASLTIETHEGSVAIQLTKQEAGVISLKAHDIYTGGLE